MRFLYIYVVERDFGFAPNPFHGYCTLATCKPGIRKTAQVEDWVMGVGGRRLKATGKCVYLMKVTEIITYDTYWTDPRFQIKKPFRNGSLVMMVGDNIYHRSSASGDWIQEDSHHSNSDGSTNLENLDRDTSSDRVLLSTHFYYFGSAALAVDLPSIEYTNGRGYSKKPLSNTNVVNFVKHIEDNHNKYWSTVIADPFDFGEAERRVDQSTGKIT
jgi:hypothetical protein